MARYTEATCKLCRHHGEKLFLKGTRCQTDKCGVTKRAFGPGQHGKGRKKVSDYGLQVKEKQKVKRIYGVLERQFRNYFAMASKSKGVTGAVLLQLLERRLDNVIFRLCYAYSRSQARQMVKHGKVLVNGKKVNVPSYLIKVGDVVEIKSKENTQKSVKEAVEVLNDRAVPSWLNREKDVLKAQVMVLPGRNDVGFPVNENMIVELYSK